MSRYAELYTERLDKGDVRYTKEDDHVVRVAFKGQNADSITILAVFDEEGGPHVAFRCYSILNFKDKKEAGALACSEINSQYRWIKFYLDKDNEITGAADAILCEEKAGDICFELLVRMTDIVDESYPTFAKARWA